MRIIGGTYRGRPLKTPNGQDIRPTSDKVRGAIFNALYSRGAVDEARVLDGFCGTGALGLEALSHGAASCTFCDQARTSLMLARENASTLGVLEQSAFRQIDLCKIGSRPSDSNRFDLVFLDPPYRKDLVPKALDSLIAGGWLSSRAVIVAETELEAMLPDFTGLQKTFDKHYGDTRVAFFQIT